MGVKGTFIDKHKIHIYAEKAYNYAILKVGILVA